MHEASIPLDAQRDLMRALLTQKAGVASTVTAHLRNLNRLLAWTEIKCKIPWTLTAPQLAMFLRDMGRARVTAEDTGLTVQRVGRCTGGASVSSALPGSLSWSKPR